MLFKAFFRVAFAYTLSLILRTAAEQTSTKSFALTVSSNRNLTSISTLLSNYSDIFGALSWSEGFTFLAPSNDAFDKIPYTDLSTVFANNDSDSIHAILQYHVLEGTRRAEELTSQFEFVPTWLQNSTYSNVTGGQRIGMVQQSQDVFILTSGLGTRSTITTPDIQASNCLIHVIDSFLVPPVNFTYTAPSFNLTSADGAFAASNLNTTLLTSSDMTVFAPSNQAMQLVGSTLESLSPGDLAQLMNYHVINSIGSGGNGPLYSSTFQNGTKILTMQGSTINIEWGDNTWFLNSARVIQSDLLFSGGVLHVLDNVLSPNATAVTPNLELATNPPVIAASSVTDVPYASFDPPTSYVPPPPSTTDTGLPATSEGPSTTLGAAATSSTKLSEARRGRRNKVNAAKLWVACCAILPGLF